MSKLVSVILTGGKSSRMGYENKSFLKITSPKEENYQPYQTFRAGRGGNRAERVKKI